MMQAGLNAADIYMYRADVDEKLLANLLEYCAKMNVRSDLLIIGSMLFIMGIVRPPADLPDFDEICGQDPNFDKSADKSPTT
jgi:hypothetical protein